MKDLDLIIHSFPNDKADRISQLVKRNFSVSFLRKPLSCWNKSLIGFFGVGRMLKLKLKWLGTRCVFPRRKVG
jgi:hypothetical protein